MDRAQNSSLSMANMQIPRTLKYTLTSSIFGEYGTNVKKPVASDSQEEGLNEILLSLGI